MTQSVDGQRPNFLFVMCDQYRFPRFSYGEHGFRDPIKHILGFQGDDDDLGDFAQYFPGFTRLRKHAVVLRNQIIAATACVPSRAALFTGQYGTRTGVVQTDGIFKSGEAKNYPWLQPDGIPTIGDWFRAAGYDTHYFGKCHFANPPDRSLLPFGFDSWELSYPEPHGAAVNNLGMFRDYGFEGLVTNFLRQKGLGLDYDRKAAELSVTQPDSPGPTPDNERPWFAVASFTNPHDIATYPLFPRVVLEGGARTGLVEVPTRDDVSVPPVQGTWRIPLNPKDFPRDCATASPTRGETLLTKPDCQFDYSLKIGLALNTKLDSEALLRNPNLSGVPFPLTSQPEEWCRAVLQYYAYLHHCVDKHIAAVLSTLDEVGLRDNTIVVFVPDHGEYGGAHGMLIEKWHTAYEEALHVPLVVSSPLINEDENEMRQVDALTSHIDILPTLLGLAGIGAEQRRDLAARLRIDHIVPEPVGADLAPLIEGKTDQVIEPDRKPREGVLFMTDDEICELLPRIDDPHSRKEEHHHDNFLESVRWLKQVGVNQPPEWADPKAWKQKLDRLKLGSVCQPNLVRCVRTPRYKLVRYYDPTPVDPKADQWELYDLESDPNELANLLVHDAPFPTPADPSNLPPAIKLNGDQIKQTAHKLRALLADLEQKKLGPGDYPSN